MSSPLFTSDSVTLHLGDCLDVMAAMEDCSVDAVVCDPPYGLVELSTALVVQAIAAWMAGDRTHVPDGRGFMGREWDRFVPPPGAWDECLRVLKPGGHLLAFAGTRTLDLMTLSIRIAGFEIRDGIEWIYGSGFPKSRDVSKAIDKAAGAEREVVGRTRGGSGLPPGHLNVTGGSLVGGTSPQAGYLITVPATDGATKWDGWGTALKPSHEPVVVARKPLAGTVAANVLEHGTGVLNIDGCRVANGTPVETARGTKRSGGIMGRSELSEGPRWSSGHEGRWPPNILLTHDPECNGSCVPGCPVAELDRQSGTLISSKRQLHHDIGRTHQGVYAKPAGAQYTEGNTYGDSGGASRFFPVFRYQAKAPKSERPRLDDGTAWPTVKPLELMRWLVRLVTPPGGLVLDPFCGTGTTGEACALEGFRCVLIERDPVAAELALQRLRKPAEATLFGM